MTTNLIDTPEQIGRRLAAEFLSLEFTSESLARSIAEAIHDAILDERERCAALLHDRCIDVVMEMRFPK